jgi:hypothetical protein
MQQGKRHVLYFRALVCVVLLNACSTTKEFIMFLLGACPRISLISSLHRSLAYQLYAGGDATLVASPWLCNAIAAPEGRARRRGMPSEGAHTAKSARSTSP